MVSFSAHFNRAECNLSALQTMLNADHCDWQITISFYTALHLVSAHMAKYGEHAHRHDLTKLAILPSAKNGPAQVDKETFAHYCTLEGLSRMARYLHKDGKAKDAPLYPVVIKPEDSAEALECLHAIMKYFSSTHHVNFEKIKVNCKAVAENLKNAREYFEV